MSEISIQAQNLSIGYKQKLYEGLSFQLRKGEMACIIGANGTGKSTLLRTIAGQQAILGGDVIIQNNSISKLNENELSQLVGVVLTDSTSVGGLRVRELVELGRYPYTGFFGKLTAIDKKAVDNAMNSVNITHKSDSYMSELSDGERQKVMIAKALSQECPILLLDEPTAFLDVEGRIEIMKLLHDLAHKAQKTILITTHDTDLSFKLADKLWLLSKNEGLKTGVVEDMVLSGELDLFFTSENIQFDRDTGKFAPDIKANKYIKLTTDTRLCHWVYNILARNSFQATEIADKAEFYLIVEDKKTIYIEFTDKNRLKLKNFEELSSWLRTYKRS